VPKKKRTNDVRRKYEFIKANHSKRSVRMMCRLLDVAPSGYYAWLKNPKSNRAKEDARLLRLIRASFKASQGVYGAPRVFLDLREAGETCSKHRVARLMRENNMRAVAGYRTRRYIAGKPAELIPNLVKRNFTISQPDRVWVTDITYVRTWEGWLYVAIVLDLFSRKVIGWAARQTIHRDLVLDAILMAVLQRSQNRTIVHTDQGTQYGSDDEPSMSRRGNCWDNAVAESFFSSLKKERIKKKIYKNRQLAIEDISDYIDSFYNRTRRHQHLGGVSPDEFEAAATPPKTGVHCGFNRSTQHTTISE
jgi:putative transposase